MLQAAKQIMKSHPEISYEAAAATPTQAAIMRTMANKASLPITITASRAHELMQRATFGLVCSGTATLEAACYGLPYALVYKVAWLTYLVGRLLIKVPFLGIINILANRPLIHEFIQHQVTPRALAQEALSFLMNREASERLTKEVSDTLSSLQGESAYEKAAATMINNLCSDENVLN